MYQSKKQIESKMAQSKYVLKEMQKYKNKVFVNNGIDEETGAQPLQALISSFLAHTRSVLQYAYKECKERNKKSVYEAGLNNRPLIGVFRDLRNTDIHEKVIGTHTVISCSVQLYETEAEANAAEPKQTSVHNELSKPVTITDELLEELQANGRSDLLAAIQEGKSLYETVEHDGESDLYVLCESYLSQLTDFVSELECEGAVT